MDNNYNNPQGNDQQNDNFSNQEHQQPVQPSQPPAEPYYQQPPQQPPAYYPPAAPVDTGRGFGIASLVLGIISIVFCCVWYVAIIAGALAIIFGVIAKKRNTMFGGAKVGFILGIVGVALTALVYIAAISFLASFFSELGWEAYYY